MRVQHNIMALNANRNLNGNNNQVSKSLEKLSSGYRINRAGDDAAGLAISEKMRAQISCLTQAETNCNDGISLIQTAEGALTEVHDMLNRMVELAEQSANGTYEDSVDRANLQDEIEQLKSEIDRIADSTNFNGIELLDGSLAHKFTATGNGTELTVKNAGLLEKTDKLGISLNANNAVATSAVATSVKTVLDSTKATDEGIYTVTYDVSAVTDKEVKAKYENLKVVVDVNNATTAAGGQNIAVTEEGKLSLQIGESSDTFNILNVQVSDMHTKALGVSEIDVGNQTGAQDAVATIKTAINKVSSQRGTLGALQNRLEHTVNNLSVTNENITNAESRIRDTDMAKEMMQYTSKNILTQAAQSMLAQANQQPQQVLSLLQ